MSTTGKACCPSKTVDPSSKTCRPRWADRERPFQNEHLRILARPERLLGAARLVPSGPPPPMAAAAHTTANQRALDVVRGAGTPESLAPDTASRGRESNQDQKCPSSYVTGGSRNGAAPGRHGTSSIKRDPLPRWYSRTPRMSCRLIVAPPTRARTLTASGSKITLVPGHHDYDRFKRRPGRRRVAS